MSPRMYTLVAVLVVVPVVTADAHGVNFETFQWSDVKERFWDTLELLIFSQPSSSSLSPSSSSTSSQISPSLTLSDILSQASSSFSTSSPFLSLLCNVLPALAAFVVHVSVKILFQVLSTFNIPQTSAFPPLPDDTTLLVIVNQIIAELTKLAVPFALALSNTRFHDRHMGPFRVQCNSTEADCLRIGNIPYEGVCHLPLANAMCPEEQWLVLDERAAKSGRLRAICAPVWPCGPESQMLRADGRCHSDEDIRRRLCPGDQILHLPNGDAFCSPTAVKISVVGEEKSGVCNVNVLFKEGEYDRRKRTLKNEYAINFPGPECTQDDSGNCALLVKYLSSNVPSGEK